MNPIKKYHQSQSQYPQPNIHTFQGAKQVQYLPELENSILSTLLVNFGQDTNTAVKLTEDHFYVPQNKIIFKAIEQLRAQNKEITPITVSLVAMEISGNKYAEGEQRWSDYIAVISFLEYDFASVNNKAAKLHELYLKRALAELLNKQIAQCYKWDSDPFQLIQETERELMKLNETMISDDSVTSAMVSNTVDSILESAEQGVYRNESVTAKAPYQALQPYFITGFKKGNLIILAGRPGMGKTSVALDMAIKMSQSESIGFLSIEMSVESANTKNPTLGELEMRLLANISGVAMNRYESAMNQAAELKVSATKIFTEMEWGALKEASKIIREKRIVMEYLPSVDLDNIKQKFLSFVKNHKTKVIIVDYLQLIDNNSGNREQSIAEVSKTLKNIAGLYGITIIALAQLSRAVETRGGDKRPILSDLRDSGGIEQDADKVIFVYRPEYYEIEVDSSGRNVKNTTILIHAKNRGGKVGDAYLQHDLSTFKYSDFEETTFGAQPITPDYPKMPSPFDIDSSLSNLPF